MKTIKVDIKDAVKNYAIFFLDKLQCDVDCIDKDYVRDVAEFQSNLEALSSPDVTTKYTTFRRLMKEGHAMFLLSPEQFDVLEAEKSDCGIELVESLETRLGVVFGENCNF